MSIEKGQAMPEGAFGVMTEGGPGRITTGELFSGKKVVLFSVPGAFTPTCSNEHLPGYVNNADALHAKGVDQIACMAVNDVFVMDAWGRAAGAGDSVLMLADGIETELRDTGQTEVRSAVLAEMVLERLQPLDEVASVRYASSYVEPGGIEEMLSVIRQTLDRRELQSIRETNLPLVAEETESSD